MLATISNCLAISTQEDFSNVLYTCIYIYIVHVLLFTILLSVNDLVIVVRFVRLCEDAYLILRRNASLFINMLAMMLQTGIPELRSIDDLNYVR